MKVGFTGTRNGLSELQSHALRTALQECAPKEFGHGDCIGADAQAAHMAYELGIRIVCFPPVCDSHRAFVTFNHEVMPAETYFARNRRIVNWCDMLIGCPPSMGRLATGGTWYTLNYADKAKKRHYICWPNGTISRFIFDA